LSARRASRASAGGNTRLITGFTIPAPASLSTRCWSRRVDARLPIKVKSLAYSDGRLSSTFEPSWELAATSVPPVRRHDTPRPNMSPRMLSSTRSTPRPPVSVHPGRNVVGFVVQDEVRAYLAKRRLLVSGYPTFVHRLSSPECRLATCGAGHPDDAVTHQAACIVCWLTSAPTTLPVAPDSHAFVSAYACARSIGRCRAPGSSSPSRSPALASFSQQNDPIRTSR
jgi:hypothetical protein